MADGCRVSWRESAAIRCYFGLALCLALGFALGAAWAVGTVVPPGAATERQLMNAIDEMTQLMEDAGRSQQQVDLVIRELRCKYTDPKAEGCSDDEGEETDMEQSVESGGTGEIRPAPRRRDRGGNNSSGRRR